MNKYKKYLIAIIVLLILIVGPGYILSGLSNGLEKAESVNWTATFKGIFSKISNNLVRNETTTVTPEEPVVEEPIEEPPAEEEGPSQEYLQFLDYDTINGDGDLISNLYVNTSAEGIEALKKALPYFDIETETNPLIPLFGNLGIALVPGNCIENVFVPSIDGEDFFLLFTNGDNGVVKCLYSTFNGTYEELGVIINTEIGWNNINEDGEIKYENHSIGGTLFEFIDEKDNTNYFDLWGGQENFNDIFRCKKDDVLIDDGAVMRNLDVYSSFEAFEAMKTVLSLNNYNSISFQYGVDKKIIISTGVQFGLENADAVLYVNTDPTTPIFYIINDSGYYHNPNLGSGEICFDCGEGYTIDNWGGKENFNKIFYGEIDTLTDFDFYGDYPIAEGLDIIELHVNDSQEGINALRYALDSSGKNFISINVGGTLVCLANGTYFTDKEGLSSNDLMLFTNRYYPYYSTFVYDSNSLNKEIGWGNLINGDKLSSISGILDFGSFSVEDWGGQENLNKIFQCSYVGDLDDQNDGVDEEA